MSQGGCLIGLDIGSSEVKGVLLAASGRLLAGVSRHNRLLAPRDGWVELDPAGHLENVCGILRELAAAAPEKVMAVAMAAASGNTLLTTEAGEPLGNIISWMDRRASERIPAALSGLEAEDVRRIAGWPCVGSFPLAHLAWLRENRPDSLRRAGHVGMDTDWLAYQLTGIWRMDHSTATTFHLQDQATGGYYQPFLDRLGIERQRLSELIAPREAPERRVRVFDEMAGLSRPGANGVKIDLRQKPQAPDADPADVSRAVMESAARLIADKLAEASSAGLSYRRAVMVGGPSRSPVWPAIVADITGLEVEVGGRGAGARGAAMLAGIGAGFYGDEQDALAVWGRGRGFDG